jgi:hypothetical protein
VLVDMLGKKLLLSIFKINYGTKKAANDQQRQHGPVLI